MSEEKRAPGRSKAAAPALTTPDAIEIAMDAAATGETPGDAALEVLRANVDLMREQIGLARNERFRNRIKAVRDAALTFAVLAVVAVGAWLVWDASRASGTVIEAFSATPALEESGLTGAVAANRLRDELNALSEQVEQGSATRRRSTRSGAEGLASLDVAIPETGASLEDVLTWTRRRFGSETVVSGEVAPAPAGQVTITVRVDGAAVGRATAPAADPASAFAIVASAVYAKVEPWRNTILLTRQMRRDEALVQARALTMRGSAQDRAWAWNAVNNVLRAMGDMRGAAEAGRRSTEMNPRLPNAWGAVWEAEMRLGHTAHYTEALEGLSRLSVRNNIAQGTDPERAPSLFATTQGQLALEQGDIEGALTALQRGVDTASRPEDATRPLCLKAEALVRAHRLAEAERLAAPFAHDPQRWATYCLRSLAMARVERGDWTGLAAVMTPLIDDRSRGYVTTFEATQMVPLRAVGPAATGRMAEAETWIGTTPLDCTPCRLSRARIAEMAGDRPRADREFAEAIRQAPNSPYGHQLRAETRRLRGDLPGALAGFETAARLAPRWADPLKGRGDVLMAQGDVRGAIRRYEAAAERAPRWGGLHLAWGRALARQGDAKGASDHYRRAAGLDLDPAERAAVSRLLARAGG